MQRDKEIRGLDEERVLRIFTLTEPTCHQTAENKRSMDVMAWERKKKLGQWHSCEIELFRDFDEYYIHLYLHMSDKAMQLYML